jgi:hypothetical protein
MRESAGAYDTRALAPVLANDRSRLARLTAGRGAPIPPTAFTTERLSSWREG